MYTYLELKAFLETLTPEQLEQPAQIMLSQPDHDKSIPLHAVLGCNTVHYYVTGTESDEESDTTRSSVDNEHHSDSVILLADYNMFAEDGTMGYDLFSGDRFYGGNKKDVEADDEFNKTFPQ